MLFKDDQTLTLHMKSSTFWNTSSIKQSTKMYDQPPNIQYKIDNLKKLNLNYNNSNIRQFNEKVKTSNKFKFNFKVSKKTYRNNR